MRPKATPAPAAASMAAFAALGALAFAALGALAIPAAKPTRIRRKARVVGRLAPPSNPVGKRYAASVRQHQRDARKARNRAKARSRK